ncbi:MAG: ketol-acid reductoisomerase [Candidatus Omnitrophica bacterium CG11_big_fil_rev_8_21_14_0_20_64_10]|nr:MAG: ketol-acid reductoisomerase [Candidatus Omnitrophica bacterium CG11_big_fil_rev_8_21_14_0_20_64_10]
MPQIYYEKDADLKVLAGKRIAILGYGIQGRGQALNLRDSGLEVVVAQRPGGPNYDKAVADGFTPTSIPEACAQSDVIMLLLQDTLAPEVYRTAILPHLKAGKALGFSHGFNIHYYQIEPPKNVDVFMIAPKGPGSLVRELYEEGGGVPALLAVHQDATGQAKRVALAYAKGLGSARAGVLETTFAEETETDLFGEQAVLCGGVSELIQAGFQTLTEKGYQPEVAYFECLHELKLIVDMIYKTGIHGMWNRVSETARFGGLTRGGRVVNEETRAEMRRILCEIRSGKFAQEWINETQAGRPRFKTLMRRAEEAPIEAVGARLRGMMSWINPEGKPAATANRKLSAKRSNGSGRKLAPPQTRRAGAAGGKRKR